MTAPPNDLATLEAALARWDGEMLSGIDKGLPDGMVRLGEVGRQGWNVLRGDVPLPSLVLKDKALTHNIARMQSYCDAQGAWLTPHGKTTMTPALFYRQLAAGAWAITVANLAQLQVCRAFGIGRVFVANEMVTAHDAAYLASQLRDHPEAEIYVAVDSEDGIAALVDAIRNAGAPRPQRVLIDFGMPGGRCGVRTVVEAAALASSVRAAAPYLDLVGVNGYEGIAVGETKEERLVAADAYLARLGEAARAVQGFAPGASPFLVAAGGSQYFDRAVALLGREAFPDCQLVLRSGGYVTHDSSFFDKSSPWGAQSWRPQPGEPLVPAIEVWSAVLSLPEPGLSILGMGGRDMPTDIELPNPRHHSAGAGPPSPLDESYRIIRSNDQHAYMTFPSHGIRLGVGDFIGSGISHPCTAFDKWRVIFLVDGDYNVVGAVRTFF